MHQNVLLTTTNRLRLAVIQTLKKPVIIETETTEQMLFSCFGKLLRTDREEYSTLSPKTKNSTVKYLSNDNASKHNSILKKIKTFKVENDKLIGSKMDSKQIMNEEVTGKVAPGSIAPSKEMDLQSCKSTEMADILKIPLAGKVEDILLAETGMVEAEATISHRMNEIVSATGASEALAKNENLIESDVKEPIKAEQPLEVNGSHPIILLNISVACRPVRLPIDTGATISLLKNSILFDDIEIQSNTRIRFSGISGAQLITMGFVLAKMKLGKYYLDVTLPIVDNSIRIPFDGILGMDICGH